jgi:hypothetical protein
MTEKSGRADQQALSLKYVPGANRTDGINQAEASVIINDIKVMIDEQVTIPNQYKLSIGIVSFFRDQAEYLQDQLYNNIPLETIQLHKIRAGTPYAFQGEERDIMLISCAVTAQCPAGSLAYLNRQDVFNVAITRGREKQTVYHSLRPEEISQGNLLRRYFDFILGYKKQLPEIDVQRQTILQEFTHTFAGLGMQALVGYPVAGLELDLTLQKDGEIVAIDLVGFPGCPVQEVDTYRYHIFERAGLRIIPIAYSSWLQKRQQIVDRIQQEFIHQKEKNTAARLSVNDFSHHWTKLLAYDPNLARTVRSVEADLITLKLSTAVDTLGRVIEQQQLVAMVLREKLSPNELTFARYSHTAEQVLLNSLDHFSQIVLLQKSLLQNASTEHRDDRQRSIGKLLAEVETAIQTLEQLALQWSKTNTKVGNASVDMDSALSELNALIKNIDS